MQRRGAVLTGGASRRMGRDKALLQVDGQPMASIVAGALVAAGCAEVIAVGGDPAQLGQLQVPFVADVEPDSGPLGGIVSALEWFARQQPGTPGWVAVAACDLPLLTPAVVTSLFEAAGKHADVAAAVAFSDRIEPALAVWNIESAGRVRGLFDGGERAVHRVLDRLDVVRVVVDPALLHNVNTPGDVPGYPGEL